MEIEWRRLRADELRDRAAANAIVIIPVAALEQHGPHLPVEVDSTLGEELARRIAREIAARGEPVVVLPVLWTGISEHHMRLGGTISLEFDAFAAVVGGIVKSVARHGFRRIALLNAHGGNESALRVIVDDLTPRLEARVVQFTYWHAAADVIAAILERQTVLLHACEAETSMEMAVHPELVATDRIPHPADQAPGSGIYRWRRLDEMSASGVIGDPSAASPEKGELLFRAIAAALAEKLCAAEPWSDSPR
jgi:creatinine amidohydrolase